MEKRQKTVECDVGMRTQDIQQEIIMDILSRLPINAFDEEAPDESLALKSDFWRKIDETGSAGWMNGIQIHDDIGELCLAFVDGAFHWLGMKKYCVVSFNILNEMYGEIPLPVIVRSSNRIVEDGILAVGGRICYYDNDDIKFNLWVMKDYGVKES
ncbi:hypothetical protein RND71_037710 [Anisodus tanguticus]|uniref:F-box protein n=1 Tax=Anisodus tanguticus TaxID=243964 RepID=A0AAE1QXL9_9SOLA|nr:hypothetical protein RND71_037710 [Anisodus tanguticus]